MEEFIETIVSMMMTVFGAIPEISVGAIAFWAWDWLKDRKVNSQLAGIRHDVADGDGSISHQEYRYGADGETPLNAFAFWTGFYGGSTIGNTTPSPLTYDDFSFFLDNECVLLNLESSLTRISMQSVSKSSNREIDLTISLFMNLTTSFTAAIFLLNIASNPI